MTDFFDAELALDSGHRSRRSYSGGLIDYQYAVKHEKNAWVGLCCSWVYVAAGSVLQLGLCCRDIAGRRVIAIGVGIRFWQGGRLDAESQGQLAFDPIAHLG